MNTTTTRQKPNKLSHVKRDRGYRFVDRDPAMVELCSIITNSGMSTEAICAEIHKWTKGVSTVSKQTIDNWMNGKTRRPQNYTLDMVGMALGVTRKWAVTNIPAKKDRH